jgi:hypothetical protein
MKKISKPAALAPAASAPTPVKKTPEKIAKKTPVASKPVAAAPAVKTAPAPATKIVAQIDIGFGNTLYVRGEGSGLSWEKGVPLECVSDDQWALSLAETSRPIVFKFLINDLTWSSGDDYVAQPGGAVVVTPAF